MWLYRHSQRGDHPLGPRVSPGEIRQPAEERQAQPLPVARHEGIHAVGDKRLLDLLWVREGPFRKMKCYDTQYFGLL